MLSQPPRSPGIVRTLRACKGLLLVTLSLAVLPFLAACSRETATAKTTTTLPLAVRTVRVEPRPVEQTVELTGTLVSSVAVDVKAELPGRLVRVLKEEGDGVRQGELLVEQDQSNALLGVQQAQAHLETAEAALARVKVAEEHARIEDERARNLLRSGGITDRDFQAAQMALKDTQAQLRLAAAQVEQARQALAIAQKRLSDCRVYSPIAGVVERRHLNLGAYADGGSVLFRVVDNQRLELESYVSSDEISRLREGQTITYSVAAYAGETFTARIKAISPAVQSANRSVLVIASAPNPGGRLKAGMFVRGRIITGVKPEGYVIPADSVWRRPNQPPFVFIVEQGKARRRPVTLGMEQPGEIEITEGVGTGDVVINGQYLELADGSPVSPVS